MPGAVGLAKGQAQVQEVGVGSSGAHASRTVDAGSEGRWATQPGGQPAPCSPRVDRRPQDPEGICSVRRDQRHYRWPSVAERA